MQRLHSLRQPFLPTRLSLRRMQPGVTQSSAGKIGACWSIGDVPANLAAREEVAEAEELCEGRSEEAETSELLGMRGGA